MRFQSSLPTKMITAFVWLLAPSVLVAGDSILIYQNTLGEFLFRPGRGRWVADDMTTWPGGLCALERFRVRVSGGVDGGGGTFKAQLALYDGCPSAAGIQISGPTMLFEDLADDASITHDLLADFSDRGFCADSSECQVSQQNCADNSTCQADPLEIPPNVWLRIRFDTDDAGVLMGAPAQLGFSADAFNERLHCTGWFGGWPAFPHASFWVEMFAAADCVCGADSDCDDGQFCNGSETCRQDGRCDPGTAPCDTGFVCHEIDDTCRCDGNDDCAEDGLFCNGEEICVGGLCVSAGPPCALPTPICFEQTDTCRCGSDTDCDDDDACNGVEFCDSLGACQNGLGPDCNGNGIPDGCEPDCNGSGAPDDCDILDGTSLDCQKNDIPDECEEDCNNNGVPDDCDIADGTSPDCQANGIPDECDSFGIYSADSGPLSPFDNRNPQIYTIANPPEASGFVRLDFTVNAELRFEHRFVDIAINGHVVGVMFKEDGRSCTDSPNTDTIVLDPAFFNNAVGGGDLNITMTTTASNPASCLPSFVSVTATYETLHLVDDCDNNGVPDECEIAAGTADDCQSNSIPDACDVVESLLETSGPLTPIGNFRPQTYTLDSPPPAKSDVVLFFEASANLAAPEEYIRVHLNSTEIGTIFRYGAGNCSVTPDTDSLVLPASLFNTIVAGQDARIHMHASSAVEAFVCPGAFISVTASYAFTRDDCNSNGIPDSCDVASTTSRDCQANGIPDECEIDCNSNGVPDDCDLRDDTSLDCQSNGVPDECETDCNSNNIPDDCDIRDGSSSDCQLNGTPDECEVDCNTNGVPDDCDIAKATSLDCNHNRIPDECDIQVGASNDCQGNGIPDECDADDQFMVESGQLSPIDSSTPQSFTIVAAPRAKHTVRLTFAANASLYTLSEFIDVELNGHRVGRVLVQGGRTCTEDISRGSLFLPAWTFNAIVGGGDAVITMRPNSGVRACAESFISVEVWYSLADIDCNNNGIPDDCEISSGASEDCQPNSIPDECETSTRFEVGSGQLGPVARSYPQRFEIPAPPIALGDVTLSFRAKADLGTSLEYIDVSVNDRFVGQIYQGSGRECVLTNSTIIVPSTLYNTLNDGGNVAIEMQPSSAVMHGQCIGSWLSVVMDYEIAGGDCDRSGVPDDCEADCNANGIVDACDLDGGTSADCNNNLTPDECDIMACPSDTPNCQDCNGNLRPDGCDIASCPFDLLDCRDCNGNGVPDDCDIASGENRDCNDNDIPDECDIEGGSSVDCQSNGVPDECEISEQQGDCNGNGIPDDCDIAAESSDDCQGNGVPDECEVSFLFSRASGELSPFDGRHPKSYRINRPPTAASDVTVTVSASADLSRISEFVEIGINGAIVHRVFGSLGVDCGVPPSVESFVVASALFNLLVDGGDATIDMLPSVGLDPGSCANSFITLSISYTTVPIVADCNENGLPDACDLADGFATDCNLNAVLDECETDADGDGVPDDCDACLDSDLSESVEINGCPTGVRNALLADGCTMNDLLASCSLKAHNHGQFTSCVARLANRWWRNDLLSGKAMGGLVRCAVEWKSARPSKRTSPNGSRGLR